VLQLMSTPPWLPAASLAALAQYILICCLGSVWCLVFMYLYHHCVLIRHWRVWAATGGSDASLICAGPNCNRLQLFMGLDEEGEAACTVPY